MGKNFGQFVLAAQRTNEADYLIYRVVVDGEVSELPIQWIYYLVADRQERQVVLAFTVEGGLIERFAEADQHLLSSFRLGDPEVATRPTAATR